MTREGPKWGREGLFPANPDLPDILGRMDFDFENFYFLGVLDAKLPVFQVPDFQISRNLAWAQLGPGLGPSLGPGLGPGLGPDAAAGRILRSQPDPSPNAPRDEIRRKDPCCDLTPHPGG